MLITKLAPLLTGRKTIAALLFYYTLFIGFYMPFSPLNTLIMKNIGSMENVLDLQEKGYTAETVWTILTHLQQVGRADYIRNLWTIDILIPLFSCISSAMLLIYLVRKICWNNNLFYGIGVIPLIIFLADMTENTLLTSIVLGYPTVGERLVFFASTATQIKWGAISVNLIAIVVLLLIVTIQWMYRSVKKR